MGENKKEFDSAPLLRQSLDESESAETGTGESKKEFETAPLLRQTQPAVTGKGESKWEFESVPLLQRSLDESQSAPNAKCALEAMSGTKIALLLVVFNVCVVINFVFMAGKR